MSNSLNGRQYSVDYKLETYLKIARLYLEDEDPVQAEAYINRASLLQAETKNEQLQIYYKVRCLENFFFYGFRINVVLIYYISFFIKLLSLVYSMFWPIALNKFSKNLQGK